MNNGHFSRQGQHNNRNRNRNRNRRHSGGGHSGGGGNNGNRVLDSNGPDVKLRGTAQTIAEKYMQLGRDAHLSGDNVMSESYYQHGEHYYRLWLAAQPAGQPIQFSRRPGEEELDNDQTETMEGDDDALPEAAAESADTGEAPVASEEREVHHQSADQAQRPFRNRDQNRDGQRDGGRERFRNRWPRRNDRNFEANGEAQDNPQPQQNGSDDSVAAAGNWETPSFLTRPAPVAADGDDPGAPERKPRREFKPRRPREPAASEDAGTVETGE